MLFFGFTAQAHLTSDFDMHIGYANFSVTSGDNFDRTLTSVSVIETSYNLYFSGSLFSLNIQFTEMITSSLGNLAYSRLGIGARYYPFEANGTRVIFDNETYGKIWRPTIFMALNVGFASLAVDSEDDQGFNAVLLEMLFKAGLEVPISQSWLLMTQLGLAAPINSESSSNPDQSVNYQGLTLLFGTRTSF